MPCPHFKITIIKWSKNEVTHKEILLSSHAPPEYADLIRDYCREFFVSKGMIADFAIHDKGDGNPHPHILLTMRVMDEKGRWKSHKEKKKGIQTNIGNLNQDIKTANRLMQSVRQIVRSLKRWLSDLKEKRLYC